MSKTRTLRTFYILALFSAAVIAFFVTDRATRSPQIVIEAPEARMSGVLVGVCSVFMRIVNSGDGGDDLVEARVDIPGTVAEIHDMEDGKMRRRERIHVPARSTAVLRPLSYHIMTFKMPVDMKEGYEFALHLRFEKSGERTVQVKIVK